jgi:hypothetical protein
MLISRKLILRIQQVILDLNDDLPIIGKFLSFTWSVLQRLNFKLNKKIQDLKGRLMIEIDPNKVYWINPDLVKFVHIKNLEKLHNSPKILKGNRNIAIKKFSKTDLDISLNLRFKSGKSWTDTEHYHKILKEISTGKTRYGCSNIDEWNNYLSKLDYFYDELKQKNNVQKEELLNINSLLESKDYLKDFNNIVVNIDRNGKLLLIKGEHLLSIFKILKIPQIPIKIGTRHKKWIKFKKELKYFSRRGKLYQQLTHPDLQDFPFKYGDIRFNMIKENMSNFKGTLLDIGTNLGYFCHKFEDEGFKCYAVEINPLYIYFLKKIKKIESRNFEIISDSIFRYNKKNDLVFDVGLALNIFHNLIKRKRTFLKLKKFLKRLKVKELFFGAHNPIEFKGVRVYKNFTPTQFTDFIIKNSCLDKVELIGKTPEGRSLFKLT